MALPVSYIYTLGQPNTINLLRLSNPSLSCADGCADPEECCVPSGKGEGDGVEHVVAVHHQEVEGQVDGVRGPVLYREFISDMSSLMKFG